MMSATSPDATSMSDHAWRDLGLSAPARRALLRAGFHEPRDLADTTEARLLELHGIGASTIVLLAAYLAPDERR